MRESGGVVVRDDEHDRDPTGEAQGSDRRELDRELASRGDAPILRSLSPLHQEDGQDHQPKDDDQGHGDEFAVDVHGATFRFGSGFSTRA